MHLCPAIRSNILISNESFSENYFILVVVVWMLNIFPNFLGMMPLVMLYFHQSAKLWPSLFSLC